MQRRGSCWEKTCFHIFPGLTSVFKFSASSPPLPLHEFYGTLRFITISIPLDCFMHPFHSLKLYVVKWLNAIQTAVT